MNNAQNNDLPLSVLLMIPCYNEGSGIEPLLREIKELNENYNTIVVDDGSEDNTYEIASELSPCLKLSVNLGIGGARGAGCY